MDNENMTLGDRLKSLRVVKFDSMPQDVVAEKVREKLGHMPGYATYSQATYSRLENNETKRPGIVLLQALAEIFQCPEEYLVFDKEETIEITHLPVYLREFVSSPENVKWIQEAWVRAEYHKLTS